VVKGGQVGNALTDQGDGGLIFETSYLPDAVSAADENVEVDVAGRDDTGETLG
jgi:hypothetical protein